MKFSPNACEYLLTGALHKATNVQEATTNVLDVIQIIYFSLNAGDKIWVDVPSGLDAEGLVLELQSSKMPCIDVAYPGPQQDKNQILFSKLSIK